MPLPDKRFKQIINEFNPEQLRGRIGLEKESLRVAEAGCIAQTPHPDALGSALTHPWITTDYSEALLELVTPPFQRLDAVLEFLWNAHKYVYDHLQHGEILWATSMPCVMEDEEQIPIAYYGESNPGKMKHVYRVGLGNRYGRAMQVIAGVHFNYSVDESIWPVYARILGHESDLRRFRDARYMGLVRNLQRYGWLIPYLFGASPAVCKSFLGGKPTRLQEFDANTYYEPYATSLRLGDIGYQNKREEGLGIKACYDSVGSYALSLNRAIQTKAPAWEKLGIKVDGDYRQLNANILQIENEYYSSVRPKPLLQGMEKPSSALKRRGVSYVEMRSLDVNAYHPLGVDADQCRFAEILMLYSLFSDSPTIRLQERWEIDRNLLQTAHRGRDPDFRLMRGFRGVRLQDWAAEILDGMAPLAELLDLGSLQSAYAETLDRQRQKIVDPEMTPSARMLAEMRDRGEGFYQFARRLSEGHQRDFSLRTQSRESRAQFDQETDGSVNRQRELEARDTGDFEAFLANYFAQGD